jgi:hypothetical protein
MLKWILIKSGLLIGYGKYAWVLKWIKEDKVLRLSFKKPYYIPKNYRFCVERFGVGEVFRFFNKVLYYEINEKCKPLPTNKYSELRLSQSADTYTQYFSYNDPDMYPDHSISCTDLHIANFMIGFDNKVKIVDTHCIRVCKVGDTKYREKAYDGTWIEIQKYNA